MADRIYHPDGFPEGEILGYEDGVPVIRDWYTDLIMHPDMFGLAGEDLGPCDPDDDPDGDDAGPFLPPDDDDRSWWAEHCGDHDDVAACDVDPADWPAWTDAVIGADPD